MAAGTDDSSSALGGGNPTTNSLRSKLEGEDSQWLSARKPSDAVCDCNREVSGSRDVTKPHRTLQRKNLTFWWGFFFEMKRGLILDAFVL